MASETSALTITDEIKAVLIRDLKPIAGRLAFYSDAVKVPVTNQVEADAANAICEQMAEDIKTVKGHEILSKIKNGLFNLHRRSTAFCSLFTDPMETSRRAIKGKIGAWQEGERQKAEALQRKLQAEADAKARAEQEKLLKKAEAMKTPEKQEQYREQAAQVIAPTITINAAKTGMKFSSRVTCEITSIKDFVNDAAIRPELCGYIDIDKLANALAKAKIANPLFEAKGVKFGKKSV